MSAPKNNSIWCKRTNTPIAIKDGGGWCVCKTEEDCCIKDEDEPCPPTQPQPHSAKSP